MWWFFAFYSNSKNNTNASHNKMLSVFEPVCDVTYMGDRGSKGNEEDDGGADV